MNFYYIGIDTAETMGLAVWEPITHIAKVFQAKGTPVGNLIVIKSVLENLYSSDISISMEELYNFKYPKVVRSLFQRYGYIKYSLVELGYKIEEVHPRSARKALDAKTKEGARIKLEYRFTGLKLTDNHSDALAVAICTSIKDGHEFDYNNLMIKPLGGTP